MMNNIRNNIEVYINENYDRLLRAAKSIVGDETADDLLQIVLLNMLERKEYSDVVKKCNNFYNYINRAMYLQYYSRNSYYHFLYRVYKPVEHLEETLKEVCDDEENYELADDLYNYINETDFYLEEQKVALLKCETINDKRLVKNKYKLKNKTSKKLFFDYFYSKNDNSCSSLRCIANKYNISHSAVAIEINHIINKIDVNYILNKNKE